MQNDGLSIHGQLNKFFQSLYIHGFVTRYTHDKEQLLIKRCKLNEMGLGITKLWDCQGSQHKADDLSKNI